MLDDETPGARPSTDRAVMLDEGSAATRTALRSILPGILWIVRIVASRYFGFESAGAVAILALDLALLLAHSWANEPLRRAMGERFGWLRSYSALPFTAWLVAGLLLLRDLWFSVAPHL